MLCENVLFLRILNFFNIAIQVIRFVVPILLIIKLILDIYHQIIIISDNSAKDKIIKRVSAAVLVFFVPTFINLFFGLIEDVTGMSFNYSECMVNIKNIDYYVELRELEQKLEYEKISQENIEKYNERVNVLKDQIKNNLSKNSVTDTTAIRIGDTYNLTDEQLTNVAKVCQNEQSTPKGAAAEAELMINLYTLREYKGSFYEFLFNSSNSAWWAPIKNGTYKSINLKSDVKEAVRKVIIDGYRTLPPYINEHDCISCGDIMYIQNNGYQANKNNHSDYIQDKTQVYTTYMKNDNVKYWIFYTFPDTNSDPFGYTVNAKQKYQSISK